MKRHLHALAIICLVCLCCGSIALASSVDTYPVGKLKPRDSVLKVQVGDLAPDFELPALEGGTVKLSDYRFKRNVVISFVPAAWTPVCSDQWPGYNIALDLFHEHQTQIIGVTVDNIPSLYAWSKAMGDIQFPILSDFWPHGKTAKAYGVLRSDGTTERALFVIDKQGIVRYVDVHDINKRPDLGVLVGELEKLQ